MALSILNFAFLDVATLSRGKPVGSRVRCWGKDGVRGQLPTALRSLWAPRVRTAGLTPMRMLSILGVLLLFFRGRV